MTYQDVRCLVIYHYQHIYKCMHIDTRMLLSEKIHLLGKTEDSRFYSKSNVFSPAQQYILPKTGIFDFSKKYWFKTTQDTTQMTFRAFQEN